MLRDKELSAVLLNTVRLKYGSQVKPVEVVFYDPKTDRHIAAYEGAEGRFRFRIVENPTN